MDRDGLVARRQYLNMFRQSLDTRTLEVESIPVDVGDPATVEALVEELSIPTHAVLYAIGCWKRWTSGT